MLVSDTSEKNSDTSDKVSAKKTSKKIVSDLSGNVSDSSDLNPIEYFYLETPNVPSEYFPLNTYGIYDRVTVEEEKLGRLKEDIIKIL